MFSMSKLRDNSKIMMGTLLFFFVASMTVGGLVGGANIITTIQGLFGKVNTSLYIGKVGEESIPISYYISERQNQINRFRQQGRSIDSRAIQNAGDFAWNNIVDRVIKDKKIDELNLAVSEQEVFDFLLLTPPPSFQDNLKSLGLYKDENNNFLLETFQNDVRFGTLPDTTRQLLLIWENYLLDYLADRKLQNLYNTANSITDLEVLDNYKKNNLNCTLDILSININNLNDTLVSVTDEEIKEKYSMDKDDKYYKDEQVVLEYVFWENIDQTNLDSLDIIDKQDSLLQLSIDFASEAEITSFANALETFEIQISDTVFATENFTNNSGFPFQMGVMRGATRFAFDNSIGATSEQFTTNNGIAVFHIIDRINDNFTPLDDVSSNIERALLKEKKGEYAKNILSNINTSDDWNTIADGNLFIEIAKDQTSTIGGSFSSIGRSNKLSGYLLNMNKNDITNVLESNTHAFIAKIKSKDDLDQNEYSAIKDSMKNSMLTNKKNQTFNNWLRAEKDKIEIIDLRHKIF